MVERPAARPSHTGAASLDRNEVRAGSSRVFTLALTLGLALALALLGLVSLPSVASSAATLPSGFREEVVFDGLNYPTAVRFSPDGRVFVAEKSGVIKVFDGLDDATPTTFADLSASVHDFWDRGLLGLALDPGFPSRPYVYVLYTHDAKVGGSAPRWSDSCPDPPGATTDGCVVSGRLSRLQAAGNQMTGSERVLIEDWCQQYPSHSVGSLAFDRNGKLYVSAGDGASWEFVDYGQYGSPTNPCGDPPSGTGGAQTPPTAEGGALRSQDLRTTGDPAGLNGTILRVNPSTGRAAPGNPLYGSSDPNARRIVAYGLRNPFRFTVRPGTDEVWLGDVGWGTSEEINRVVTPADSKADNFGWPCYEGDRREGGYDNANLNVCENLYGATGAVTAPFYAYVRNEPVVAGESCPASGGSSISGMAFYNGGSYPDEYDGALFFADYARRCIWVMREGANGVPDPGTRRTFLTGAENLVDLQVGTGGDLFYVDLLGGAIRRVSYGGGGGACPTGQYLAEYYNNQTLGGTSALERCENGIDYDWGPSGSPSSEVEINFSARWTGTHTFEKGDYTFSATADDGVRVWVDGKKIIDEWREQSATTYEATLNMSAGEHEVKVEYYDGGVNAVARLDWRKEATEASPTATIDSPSPSVKWKVGDNIEFSGSATDPEDGILPARNLFWSLTMHHCPSSASSCHAHPLQTFKGVSGGSFTAPDHEYPSYMTLQLTATDSSGSQHTKSVRLDPQTVELTFRSNPSRLRLVVGGIASTTPFDRTVIAGSKNSLSAPSPQRRGSKTYKFGSWSDGKAQSHDIVAGNGSDTYRAIYRETGRNR